MRQDKWSYKVINIKLKTFAKGDNQAVHLEDQFNQLGMVGWELVNVTTIGTSMKAIFKR